MDTQAKTDRETHVPISQRLHLQNMRIAREVSHRLCPEMAKAMHTAKFEDWVHKLATSQITQVRALRAPMCF